MAEEIRVCKCGSLSFRCRGFKDVPILVCTSCGSKYENPAEMGVYNKHKDGWTSFNLEEIKEYIPENLIYCGKVGKLHILRGDDGYWVGRDDELRTLNEQYNIDLCYFASIIMNIKGE